MAVAKTPRRLRQPFLDSERVAMMDPHDVNQDIVNKSTEDKLKFLQEMAEIPSWERDCDSVYRELLDDSSPEVRRMCLRAFWDIGGPEDLDRIVEIASNDPAPEVRAEACATLGVYVYEGAIMEELEPAHYDKLRSFLIGRLRDETEDLKVRRCALESLGFDGEGEIAETLEWAYAEPNPLWKASAVFAMGRAGGERWVPRILDALESKDQNVMLAAVKAVSESYCEDATPQLRNLAMSNDKDVRVEAIWALGRAGGPGAIETLEMCAADDDPEVREMAELAIEEYHMFEDNEEDTMDWDEADGADDLGQDWGSGEGFDEDDEESDDSSDDAF